jgi:hypothetical protein
MSVIRLTTAGSGRFVVMSPAIPHIRLAGYLATTIIRQEPTTKTSAIPYNFAEAEVKDSPAVMAHLWWAEVGEREPGVRQDNRMDQIILKILLIPSDIPLGALLSLLQLPAMTGFNSGTLHPTSSLPGPFGSAIFAFERVAKIKSHLSATGWQLKCKNKLRT